MEIHFGRFLRSKRIEMGLTVRRFAELVKKSEPRIIEYEKQPVPPMYESTYGSVARALGMTPDSLTAAWKSTPMPVIAETKQRKDRRAGMISSAIASLAAMADPAPVLSRLAPGQLDKLLEIFTDAVDDVQREEKRRLTIGIRKVRKPAASKGVPKTE